MRTSFVAALVCAGAALAGPPPKIAVHPLVVTGVDSKRERDVLITSFPALVQGSGAIEMVPPEKVEAVLNKMPQLGCLGDGADRCLADVADQTDSLYALKLELARALKPGEWRLAATLMRRDGTVVARPDIVTFSESKTMRFSQQAMNAIEALLAQLALARLPPTPPPLVVKVPPAEPPPAIPPPPPLVEEQPPSGSPVLRGTSFVVGGLGIAGLATGAVFTVLASSDAATVKNSLVQTNGKTIGIPESSKSLAQRVDTEATAATACYIAGGVLLATGVVMFALSGHDDAAVVSFAPVGGGGVAVLSGRF